MLCYIFYDHSGDYRVLKRADWSFFRKNFVKLDRDQVENKLTWNSDNGRTICLLRVTVGGYIKRLGRCCCVSVRKMFYMYITIRFHLAQVLIHLISASKYQICHSYQTIKFSLCTYITVPMNSPIVKLKWMNFCSLESNTTLQYLSWEFCIGYFQEKSCFVAIVWLTRGSWHMLPYKYCMLPKVCPSFLHTIYTVRQKSGGGICSNI